jgi:hypothetical protein
MCRSKIITLVIVGSFVMVVGSACSTSGVLNQKAVPYAKKVLEILSRSLTWPSDLPLPVEPKQYPANENP